MERHSVSLALPGKSVGSIPGGVFGLFPKQEPRFLGDRGQLGLTGLQVSSRIRGSHPESRFLTGHGQSGPIRNRDF